MENWADSITANEDLNSIFIGGHIANSQLLPVDDFWASGAAQIGRIELDYNRWVWSKVMKRSGGDIQPGIKTISALAIDPQGTKVAACATRIKAESRGYDNNFIFVLNAANGDRVSSLLVLKSSLNIYS